MPEASEVSTTVGPEDPHFIHHSDIPGIKLVGTVFDGRLWSLPQPAATASTAKSWQRCNDIVFSWILNSCSPEIGKSILYSNSAEIAWCELEDRFGQSNGAQLYGTQKKLTDFSQGNDSISTYFTKLKSIWDELDGMGMNPLCSCNCQCGAKIKQKKFQEDQRIVQFLMGLNDSFAVVRGTILMQNPLPKLSSIYNNLLQEEGQREIHNAVNFQADSAALYAGNSKGPYKGNYNGYNNSGFNNGNIGYHNNGYNQKNQFYKNQASGSNQQGHFNGRRGNFQQQSQPNFQHQNAQHQQQFSSKGKGQNIDDNAIPAVPIPFCNYCKKHGHKIEVCRHLQNRNRRFAGNVFNEQEGPIPSEGFVQAPNPGSNQVPNTAPGSSSGSFPFASGSSANFAGFNSSDDYNGPASSANFAAFDLIHIDLWGPYHTATYNGYKYFLTIVDDFTRCTWTHLLTCKGNAFVFIKSFIQMVDTQFGRKVKCIRLPSKVLDSLSPYQILFGKEPDLSHMRSFGCLVYASSPKPGRDKFSPRAVACVFLGYPFGKKAYKLLNLDNHSIMYSRDVVFHEHVFPYIKDDVHSFIPVSLSDCPEPTIPVATNAPHTSQTSEAVHTSTIHNTPSSIPNTTSQASTHVRQSTRQSRPPSYLQHYVCQTQHKTRSLCNFDICDHTLTSLCIQDFSMPNSMCMSVIVEPNSTIRNILPIQEPKNYEEASVYPEWQEAITAEFNALEANNTWSLVPLPPGKKSISCKWVFKVKHKSDGTIERYKARLVVKGFTQKEGIDYTKLFALL
ncbi:uncharacterized protein LOC141612789 [Silene latifolia]|uniref:uncharacterized protein LOC141612789 n=1 Tax=Silene latifolia TaxID=37657 RepID=UPI003D7875CA